MAGRNFKGLQGIGSFWEGQPRPPPCKANFPPGPCLSSGLSPGTEALGGDSGRSHWHRSSPPFPPQGLVRVSWRFGVPCLHPAGAGAGDHAQDCPSTHSQRITPSFSPFWKSGPICFPVTLSIHVRSSASFCGSYFWASWGSSGRTAQSACTTNPSWGQLPPPCDGNGDRSMRMMLPADHSKSMRRN